MHWNEQQPSINFISPNLWPPTALTSIWSITWFVQVIIDNVGDTFFEIRCKMTKRYLAVFLTSGGGSSCGAPRPSTCGAKMLKMFLTAGLPGCRFGNGSFGPGWGPRGRLVAAPPVTFGASLAATPATTAADTPAFVSPVPPSPRGNMSADW